MIPATIIYQTLYARLIQDPFSSKREDIRYVKFQK